MSADEIPNIVRLTRACEACVKAKRKCSLSYPTCARCESREITCTYTNTPLTARSCQRQPRGRSLVETPNDVPLWQVKPQDEVLVPPLIRRLAEPPCIVPIDAETNSFMKRLAKRHVVNFGVRGANVFMHKDIATSTSQMARNLQILCRQSTSIACRRLEVELQVQEQLGYILGALTMMVTCTPDVWAMLACVQCLTLVQIITLLVLRSSSLHRSQAEKRQHMLYLWTRRLWMMAPSELPSTLTRREAFLLAESVRRTIIVSCEMQAVYHALRYGWIEHNVFLDALPFERRATLWDMPSEEFNKCFAGEKQDIVSWREFVDMFDAGLVSSSSTITSFEMMLLIGAKSKPVVEARLDANSDGSWSSMLGY